MARKTPLNETFLIYEGKEVYTGAEVIFSYEDLNNSLVVVDNWAFARINKTIATFIKENCTLTVEKTSINAYRC